MDSAVNTKSKYGKQIMDTTKKQGINFAKVAGKRIINKSAEGTRDLIGNKIADKITSLRNKPRNDKNDKKEEINEEEIIIPPEKRQQII